MTFEKYQEKLNEKFDKLLEKANVGETSLVFEQTDDGLYFTTDLVTAFFLKNMVLVSACWDKVPVLTKKNAKEKCLKKMPGLSRFFDADKDHTLATEFTLGAMNGGKVVRLNKSDDYTQTVYINKKHTRGIPSNALYYVNKFYSPVLISLPAKDKSFQTTAVIMPIRSYTDFIEEKEN